MDCFLIEGGPAPRDIRVLTPKGEDVSHTVMAVDVHAEPGEMTTAVITVISRVNILAHRRVDTPLANTLIRPLVYDDWR